MNEINNFSEHAQYIAGLFDGEGCITLTKLSRLQERCKTPTYALRCRIRMTDGNVIRWLHSVIGGRYYGQRVNKMLNRKPYYEWGVAGRQGIRFLEQIYPYLRVKRLQAEIAFEYGKTLLISNKGMVNEKRKLSPILIEHRNTLRDKMLQANTRGV